MQSLLLTFGLIVGTASATMAQDFGYDSDWNTQQRYIDQMWQQQGTGNAAAPSASPGGDGFGTLVGFGIGVAVLCMIFCETAEETVPATSTEN